MVHNWLHRQHKALSEGLSEPLFLPEVNDFVYPNKTTTIRFLRFESCYGLNFSNADLKNSLYIRVHIKAKSWKFHVLNPNNSRVTYLWSLYFC